MSDRNTDWQGGVGQSMCGFSSGEEIPQWYYVKIFFIYLQIHANVYCVDLCYDKRSYKISVFTKSLHSVTQEEKTRKAST